MANLWQLRNGSTLISFIGGTTPNGGTSKLELTHEDDSGANAMSIRTTAPFQRSSVEVFRGYPYNRQITATFDLLGQDTAHAVAAIRDIMAMLSRFDTVLEKSLDGAVTTYFDCLRADAPILPYDFGTVNLSGGFVEGITITFETKPFGRPSAAATLTGAQQSFAAGTLAGAGLWKFDAGAGDVPAAADWTFTKSSAANNTPKVWAVGHERTASRHLALYNAAGTAGFSLTAVNGVANQTDANAISTAANKIVRWTAAGTSEESILYYAVDSSVIDAEATYRALLICKQNGGAVGDIYVHVKVTTEANPAGQAADFLRVAVPLVGGWCVVDCGHIALPAISTNFRIYVQAARSTGAATLDFDAAFLLMPPGSLDTSVYDMSGGSVMLDYPPGQSDAGLSGPVKIQELTDQPAAWVASASGSVPMSLDGSLDVAAGPKASPLWVAVVAAASDYTFTKTKGFSAVTAQHYELYAGLIA